MKKVSIPARVQCSLCLFLGILFYGSDSFSAPVVQRRIQAQKEAQQMMAQQYQQQIVAQQQAQQIAAYKQAVAQQQVAMYQQAAQQKAIVEYAAYKEAMQQALAKRNAELAAAEQVKSLIAQKQAAEAAVMIQAQQVRRVAEVSQYAKAVQVKKAATAQAQAQLNQEIKQYADFLVKRKAALESQIIQTKQVQAVQEMAQYNQYQQVRSEQVKAAVTAKLQAQDAQKALGAKMAQEVYRNVQEHEQGMNMAEEQETEVDIKDLWQVMDGSSLPWEQIVDQEIKALTVAEYIDRFKKVGIVIKKSPGYYVNMIDAISRQNPEYLSGPFMNVLAYAAIADYDFENGQNKDELAKQMLGEENFKANKARLQQR